MCRPGRSAGCDGLASRRSGRGRKRWTTMDQRSTDTLAYLVQPARVHRSLYADSAIFELELERIFGAAWVYVGHESQVKNIGDFFCTQIARKPIVVVRDAAGKLAVLRNQCAHRGAMVVASDR